MQLQKNQLKVSLRREEQINPRVFCFRNSLYFFRWDWDSFVSLKFLAGIIHREHTEDNTEGNLQSMFLILWKGTEVIFHSLENILSFPLLMIQWRSRALLAAFSCLCHWNWDYPVRQMCTLLVGLYHMFNCMEFVFWKYDGLKLLICWKLMI